MNRRAFVQGSLVTLAAIAGLGLPRVPVFASPPKAGQRPPRIDIVANVAPKLGEGPLWDVEEQRLYWVDIENGKLFRATHTGSELRAWDMRSKIGALALRKQGGAVVALQNGLHRFDFDSGELSIISHPEADHPQNRFNDGKVDRQGRFLAATMTTKETKDTGGLYRLDTDGSVHRLQDKIDTGNGPCWSPDGRIFYFSDSSSKTVWKYSYDPETGAIGDRQVFLSLKPDDGAPDGATVDAEGFYWQARNGVGKIVRHAPDGSVDRTIDMPVKDVTSVMFGGPKLDILFVTSMGRKDWSDKAKEKSIAQGSVFAVHGLGVTGLPENRFAD